MRILIRILQAVLPLAVIGLAGFAALMMIRNRPVVETQPAQIAPPGVRVHVVELQDVTLSVMSEGTVRPRTESQLVPEISGRVTSVADAFVEGGFFEADDVLVTIDPSSPIGQLADFVIRVPAPSPKASGGGESSSVQPMGSLFEQSLFILLDALIVMLMEKREINAADMFGRHANLE